MTLLEQSGYLWQQCELYHNNQQIRECIADAESIQQKLESLVQDVSAEMAIAQILNQIETLSVQEEIVTQLKATLFTLKKLQADWDMRRSGVKQRSSYANFISALANLNQQLAQRHQQAWQLWIAEQRAEIEIESTFLKMHLPHLNNQIDRYQSLHKQLTVKKPPETREELERIQYTLQELKILHDSMDFKIPEAVQQFFEMLNQNVQIPMNLLSDEVWVWLKQKNLLNLLMIRKAK